MSQQPPTLTFPPQITGASPLVSRRLKQDQAYDLIKKYTKDDIDLSNKLSKHAFFSPQRTGDINYWHITPTFHDMNKNKNQMFAYTASLGTEYETSPNNTDYLNNHVKRLNKVYMKHANKASTLNLSAANTQTRAYSIGEHITLKNSNSNPTSPRNHFRGAFSVNDDEQSQRNAHTMIKYDSSALSPALFNSSVTQRQIKFNKIPSQNISLKEALSSNVIAIAQKKQSMQQVTQGQDDNYNDLSLKKINVRDPSQMIMSKTKFYEPKEKDAEEENKRSTKVEYFKRDNAQNNNLMTTTVMSQRVDAKNKDESQMVQRNQNSDFVTGFRLKEERNSEVKGSGFLIGSESTQIIDRKSFIGKDGPGEETEKNQPTIQAVGNSIDHLGTISSGSSDTDAQIDVEGIQDLMVRKNKQVNFPSLGDGKGQKRQDAAQVIDMNLTLQLSNIAKKIQKDEKMRSRYRQQGAARAITQSPTQSNFQKSFNMNIQKRLPKFDQTKDLSATIKNFIDNSRSFSKDQRMPHPLQTAQLINKSSYLSLPALSNMGKEMSRFNSKADLTAIDNEPEQRDPTEMKSPRQTSIDISLFVDLDKHNNEERANGLVANNPGGKDIDTKVPPYRETINHSKKRKELLGLTDDPAWKRSKFEKVHKPSRELFDPDLAEAIKNYKLTEEERRKILILPKYKAPVGKDIQQFNRKKPTIGMIQKVKDEGFVLLEDGVSVKDIELELSKMNRQDMEVYKDIGPMFTWKQVMEGGRKIFLKHQRREMLQKIVMKGQSPYEISRFGMNRSLRKLHDSKVKQEFSKICEFRQEKIQEMIDNAAEGEEIEFVDMTPEELGSRVVIMETHDKAKKIQEQAQHALSRDMVRHFTTENAQAKALKDKEMVEKKIKSSFLTRFTALGKAPERRYKHTQFEQLVAQGEDKAGDIQSQIMEKLKYINMYKKNMGNTIDEVHEKDPKFQYMRSIMKDLDVALPILEKVIGTTLKLQSYTLNQSHSDALAKACRLFDENIRRVLFDNCGIDDTEFAAILSGLHELKDFKSIIYKRNIFDEKSMEAIIPILQKKVPYHLEEIQIIDCTIHSRITERLLRQLNMRSQLVNLTLCRANLTESSFAELLKFINKSSSLEKLDLPWSEVGAASWWEFFTFLKNNKRLGNVNLSNNQLFNDPQTGQENLDNLIFFMKRNPKLVHIELSNTSLSEDQIYQICSNLRKAISLNAVHLCQNPGITDELVARIRKRLNAPEQEPVRRINPLTEDTSFSYELKKQSNNALKEIQFMNVNKQIKVMNSSLIDETATTIKRLILNRMQGYQTIIPGSARWKVLSRPQDECWICGKHIMTIIMWNKQIGIIEQFVDLQAEENIEMQLEEIHGNDLSDINHKDKKHDRNFSREMDMLQDENQEELPRHEEDAPMIFGQFTNWQPKKMYSANRLMKYLNINALKIIYVMKQRSLCHQKCNKYSDLNDEEKQHFKKMLKELYKGLDLKNWKSEIFDFVNFQYPNLVNGRRILQQDLSGNGNGPETYIYVDMVKPGNQFYVVRHKNENYVHRFISRSREEHIPPIEKMNFKSLFREFNMDTSVFAAWKDDPDYTRKCYKYDQKLWRINRFIKDESELQSVERVIEKHYSLIRKFFWFFRSICGKPNSIDSFSMRKVAMQLGMVKDSKEKQFTSLFEQEVKKMTENDIERMFVSCKINKIEDDPKNKVDPKKKSDKETDLQRNEFTELLIRMSIYRYKDFEKKSTNPVEMLNMLIDDMIKPVFNMISDSWEEFQPKNLWNLEVNDIFVANTMPLKKLYAHYSKRPMKKKQVIKRNLGIPDFVLIDDMVQMITQDTEFFSQISANKVQQIFCLSKMLVIQDQDDKGQGLLQRMSFDEFIDFLGRIAYVNFRGTEMSDVPMHVKLEHVLIELLAIVGEQFISPSNDEEFESVSEDEY